MTRYAINWQSPRTPKPGRENNQWNIHTTDGGSFEYVCQAVEVELLTPATLRGGMLWVEGELVRAGGEASIVAESDV